MAKFRMNHSTAGRGKGAGALVIRVAGVFFIIFFLLFLFAGKQKMSQSLEKSILFPVEEIGLQDVIGVELDTLFHDYFGLLTGEQSDQVYYALIPSCRAFQTDSTLFNQLYFVNPDWVPVGSEGYYEFFKSSNLTGRVYGKRAIQLNPIDSTCQYVILKIFASEELFNYSIDYLNAGLDVIKVDTLRFSYQGY